MRLAIIASLLPADSRGGAERYVADSARWLANHHEVVLLTGSERGAVDGVPIVRLPHLPQLSPSAPYPGRVVWHALDQWLPPVHAAVSRALKQAEPDLVISHELQGLSAAAYTAIAASGVPHVHTAHDFNLLCVRTSMTRNGEYCGGRCFDCRVQRAVRTRAIKLNLTRLIGVSRYICERHIRAGVIPAERAHAIRLGTRSGNARLREVDGRGPVLGFIGSLGRHKGILTLLEAFARADSSWRLVIAGDGAYRGEVETAAQADPRIRYVGHVEGTRKDAFFDELDLVVIPSEWEEPATFVAVEAAIRGIPAVVSERGGLPETPEARTFRAGDAHELLRAVEWFVERPVRLSGASGRLLERSREYEWDTHMERVEEVLAAARTEPAGMTAHA
jgi:glycosyltransferase involved in cell wall biosynthesis